MTTIETNKDEELVKEVLAGNASAFNNLVERYFSLVYMIGYARFRTRETGEDLAQETFLQAFLHLAKLNQPQLFSAWVCRIARNLATDWQRRTQRISRLLPMVPIEELPQEVVDTQAKDARIQIETEGQNKVVQDAILKLAPELRELILLYYSEGLNKQEIAQVLGVHPSTVGRQLKKALAMLKGILEPVLRESTQPLRAEQKAAIRAIAVVSSAAVMSASSKSSLIEATGDIAQVSAESFVISGIGILGMLTKGLDVIARIGQVTITKKGIAIIAITGTILGGIYYYRSWIGVKNINRSIIKNEIKNERQEEAPQNSVAPSSTAEEHARLMRNKPSPNQTSENQKAIKDCTGHYYTLGGKILQEIQRKADGTLESIETDFSEDYKSDGKVEISERQRTFQCEQQENRILTIYGKSTSIYIIRPNGKTIDAILPSPEGDMFIPKFGQKINDSGLWNALHSYNKQDYSDAESGFRLYLQSYPNDVLIQLYLADVLVQQDKLDEAKEILAKVEKNPAKDENWLSPIIARKVKYLLTGKEKSLAHQNVWDSYRELANLYKSPLTSSAFNQNVPIDSYTTIFYILQDQNKPIGVKERPIIQEYFISPNFDLIQQFLNLPDNQDDCYVTDVINLNQDEKHGALFIPTYLYGRVQADEGNIKEAVKAYRKIIRFGQQITYGKYEQNTIGSLIRQRGENAFTALFSEGKINTAEDAELVSKTLKELRKIDPSKPKDYGCDYELVGYMESFTKQRANQMHEFHIPETRLILLETAAAIKRYLFQQGFYPSRMQDLIPKYLSSAPMDTFDNNPIKFVPSNQEMIVYSYGPDTTDDKGLLIYDPTNGIRSKGDLVVSVK